MTLLEYFKYSWDMYHAHEYHMYRYGAHVSLKEWTNAD